MKPRRMVQRLVCLATLAFAAISGMPGMASADSPVAGVGLDFYSRYIWRGSDIGDSPSIQPTLSFTGYGFQLGAWGAYPTNSQSAVTNEIDFWLSYDKTFDSGAAVELIVTDYYYPNAGVKFSNSDAHTLETGVSVTGPGGFPLTVAAYVNVANDPGNNTYFECSYPATAGEASLRFFVGAAGGSQENPGFYGTDTANVINMGVTATRPIAITDRFSLPVVGSLIYNPRVEVAYLVVGVSF